MSFAKMLPSLILIAFFIFGVSFLPQIMGSVEEGQSANISQEYKDQINASRDTAITTMSITRYIPLMLGVVALVGAVLWISKRR